MADKKYESLNIENIVASGVVAESIDLVTFSENTPNCELNKKRFPGAVYRIPDPKIACLIFSSGKIVLTGIQILGAKTNVVEFANIIDYGWRADDVAGNDLHKHVASKLPQ